MKSNRSLAISHKIQECQAGDILGLLEAEFPVEIFNSCEVDSTNRSRIFTPNSTLLTMVLSSIQEDKSLKNAVDIFCILHQQKKQAVLAKIEENSQKQKEIENQTKRKPGRPKNYSPKLPKSLINKISLNTAAYSKARNRMPIKLTQDLFTASRITDAQNAYSHWHGYRVFITDGTYIQLQDTEDIRKDYQVYHKGVASEGYPQGLLQVVTERGTGQIHCFELANRHVSELSLFYDMIDRLPSESLVLLDDLYNCFEIISKCKRKGIEIVVPAKRERSYELVEVIADGDEIIKIKTPKNRSKWLLQNEPSGTILLRRIVCKSPEGKEYVLHTTILDKSITKDEIQILYLTRWDIEVEIREIKIIMNINILRSKTREMALKELTVSLATYNLLRKIIYTSIKNLSFSPKEDFIYKFYKANQNIFIDKKGRVYSRWSTGRKRTKGSDSLRNTSKA
jgi:hypothetical protein